MAGSSGRNVDYAYDAAAGRAYYCSVADSL